MNFHLVVLLLVGSALDCQGFVQQGHVIIKARNAFRRDHGSSTIFMNAPHDDVSSCCEQVPHCSTASLSLSRRSTLVGLLTAFQLAQPSIATTELVDSTNTAEPSSMYAPKFVQQYDDFVSTPSGMSFRDVTLGTSGTEAHLNDRIVYDWSGYTIGYFGRPFQAKGGPQGGAFDKELDYERTVLGSGKIVKGLEEALIGMKAGGVRQVIVPFGALSYPQETDPGHDVVGPKPSTFSGQRALNFVLDNPRLDRTLLFNIKVIRVDSPNASGGFTRG
jgi:FKBP-type peptidyl-prolyl cis-trans isomerase